jgi:hypothetical protein
MSTEPKPAHSGDSELRWEACFEAAIEYFADNLESKTHPGQDSTAQDYFEGRGWDDKTIHQHSLGWSPAGNKNKLPEYLKARGYTADEMQATGLFGANLKPLWQGRYVFPYLDANGSPVYAISRAISEDGHPKDHFRKYAKAKTSDDSIRVSEPIYGLRTVTGSEPVIITEGVADAISIHQAGYPCVSPATTRFKQSGKAKLLAKLSDQGVSRVYVLQDAEQPSNSYDGSQNIITTEQTEPGLKGAIDTATFLSKNGIEAHVNTPPRHGIKKVDLDDYLRDGWGTLDALIKSAKPPSGHPTHSDPSASEPVSRAKSRPAIETDSDNISAIFELDITDVTGLSVDYRGKSPLGHTGDSEDYYKIYSQEWAFDHKRKVGYNALLHLLCDSGERPVGDPYGSLSDRERFIAWKHAKKNRLVSEDDPIPHGGLIFIAINEGLCDRDDLFDGWKLPPEAYNMALDLVRDEHGLDPGRDPLGFSNSKEDSAGASETSKHLGVHVHPEVTLDQAYDQCDRAINQALTGDDQYTLIDALPAQGKSYGVVKWAAENDTPLTVLTPRRDLHEQNREWCDKFGLTTYSLPAFHRNCDCANGNHGRKWKGRVTKLYQAGATAKQIHEMAPSYFGEELPCMRRGACPYLNQWNFNLNDYDVLLGHYLHGYKKEIVDDRVVVIDESPTSAFIDEFEPDEVASAVSYYLDSHDGIPFSNYTDLIENRSDQYRRDDALDWFERNNPELKPDSSVVMKNGSDQINAKAPVMTHALLVGSDLGNGWEHSKLPNGRVSARNRNPHQDHNESELILLSPPPLEDAEAVIGLDGTPCRSRWELCLGHSVKYYEVLDDMDRVSYINDTLNQTIYQMSNASKPYLSGKWVNLEEDTALITQVGERKRALPDLITSKSAIEQYRESGLLNSVGKRKYYGNLIGSNDFGASRLGLVIGSPHYGDTHLKMWGAFANEAVERIGDERGLDVDYGSFGNELLREMQAGEVLQSIMRFGRNGDGATIFVSTGAIPDWVPLAGKGSVHKWSKGMKLVLDAIEQREEWKTSDLLTTVEDRNTPVLSTHGQEFISERQVRRNLNTLYEFGYITHRKEGNGWLWEHEPDKEVPDNAHVSFNQ